MTVEVFAFRADTHGMDSEADLLERFLCVEVFSLLVISHKLFLAEVIKILHNGKVRGLLYTVVRTVGNAESGIQLGEQDFNSVNLRIGEILVAAEEVF